jgi:DNA-binding LacI/PurR family transcriptional regulator
VTDSLHNILVLNYKYEWSVLIWTISLKNKMLYIFPFMLYKFLNCMMTIREVAGLAGVSTATVSHVLNDTVRVSPKLRERVLRVVHELNYQPNYLARGLRTKQTQTVGMIIGNIANPFFPAEVRGVEDVLRRDGFNLIVGNSDYDAEREAEYYRTFSAKRVDGLVLVLIPTEPPEYLRRHNFSATPVVYIDHLLRGVQGDAVLIDNVRGSYRAVAHLIERGHRRIGIITGKMETLMAPRRLRGYELALKNHGIPLQPELIREGRYDEQSGYERATELLSLRPRPTALFACNGLMTTGCLRAIIEAGLRCPEEIALVSFDDLDWFKLMRPSITAVVNPAYELGWAAAEMLVNRMIKGVKGPPLHRKLATKLIVRKSSEFFRA